MARTKTKFACQHCGYESPKWMGKCPGCGEWNTMVEERMAPPLRSASGRSGTSAVSKPVSIGDIETKDEPRMTTNVAEFDRVLGGGLVPGSLVLVGGDPGIGKSTLLLQVSGILSEAKYTTMYITGEESPRQTKMRADRLGIRDNGKLFVLAETNLAEIEGHMRDIKPKVAVIDSIQTMHHPDVTSAAGSVAQVRECTGTLLKLAKTEGIAVFLVGHVTKEGAIAGPKILEHMVDAVIYFEGERHHAYRVLRSVKNRFGSTNEIGIFEMKEEGLAEVANPSALFLEERTSGRSGSVVIATMEGTRPVLVEIQALVTPTSFGTPRRMATGVDHHRVSLMMAVLEKRIGMMLTHHDAYVNVAGGVKIEEPAIDLGLAICMASSFRDRATRHTDVVIGEIGLTGEVRTVSRVEQRVRECQKLGFKRVIMPEKNVTGIKADPDMDIIGVSSLQEAIDVILEGGTR